MSLEISHKFTINEETTHAEVRGLLVDGHGDWVVMPVQLLLLLLARCGAEVWGESREEVGAEWLVCLGVIRLWVVSGHLHHDATILQADPEGVTHGDLKTVQSLYIQIVTLNAEACVSGAKGNLFFGGGGGSGVEVEKWVFKINC